MILGRNWRWWRSFAAFVVMGQLLYVGRDPVLVLIGTLIGIAAGEAIAVYLLGWKP